MFLWYQYFKNFATQALWTQLHTPKKWENPTLANMNIPAKTTKQIRLLQYVFFFINQIFYSTWETGLNYSNGGTSFSIEVHWEAKQLHTLEDTQVRFFCSSPKRRKFLCFFFPGIFVFDRDNSKTQGQTSTSDFKNKKMTLHCCYWML